MVSEVVGLFVCAVVITLVGVGPAVWLVQGQRRLLYAAGAAPALGLVILSLLGFPLVRFVAPARVWAWPAAIALVVVSVGLLAADWRRRPEDYRAGLSISVLGPAVLFVLFGSVLLVSPLRRGMQYAVFRANPSDAFLYMSLAESFRAVEWQKLNEGAAMTADNLEQVGQLAAESPTAILAARHVTWPLPLNKMALFGWLAELARAETPRFYFAHHLLSFMAVLPLALVLGDVLRLPGWLNYLGAAGIGYGFWARFVLETDAGYEISVLPALLLFVFAWIQVEQEGNGVRPLSPARLLLAIAAAAIAALYVPLAAVVVVALAGYYLLALLQGVRSVRVIGWHIVTLLLLVVVLTMAGQIDFVVRSTLNIMGRTATEANFTPHAFEVIKTNGLAGLWGLPPSYLPDSLQAKVAVPLQQGAIGAGLLLSAALLLGGLAGLKRDAPAAERVVLAVVAAGLLLSLFFLAQDNRRIAGKMVTYVYPYLTLAVLLAGRSLDGWLTARAQKVAMALAAGWLISQCLFGLYLANRSDVDFILNKPRPEQYDLTALSDYLDENSPRLLLVNVPREETWMFAYYAMFAFGRYPAHFQSGLVIDNNSRVQNLWLAELEERPDYAVVLKNMDYIGAEGLGTKVAETADLVLYRVTAGDSSAFVRQEATYRQQEAEKPVFPGLLVGEP